MFHGEIELIYVNSVVLCAYNQRLVVPMLVIKSLGPKPSRFKAYASVLKTLIITPTYHANS